VGEVDPDVDSAARVADGGADSMSAVVVSVGRDHRLCSPDQFRVRFGECTRCESMAMPKR
jgi:hypothetical protein